MWLPLNGTGLGTEWGARQGYERSNGPFQDLQGYFCLAAPKYNAALRQRLKRIISEGNIAYFKHDFVQLQCSAEGHGHLPTIRHGFEANLDATLKLMAYESELQPGILLDPTSYVWYSPGWLMHANYIWMGRSDRGKVKAVPQLSPREWEINYRDDHFFKMARRWRQLVPVSAALIHAITRTGRWNPGTEQETLREWSDNVMMVYGRGLQLVDLFVAPSLLPAEFWRAMGEATRWWQENSQVLEKVAMIGGNPRHGEVYGYAHWKENRGILCLLNPGIGEQAIGVPFDKSVHFRGEESKLFRARVIYPYVENLSAQFTSGVPMLFSVPGYTVMLVELEPGEAPQVAPAKPAGWIEGQGSVVAGERDWTKSPGFYEDPSLSLTAKVIVQVPDEEMERCDLFLIAHSNGALPEFPTLTLNGQPAEVRVVQGAADTPGEKARS